MGRERQNMRSRLTLMVRSQVRKAEGRPREALMLASQAAEAGGARKTGSVPAWLRTQQALALADVGDERACLTVLSHAEGPCG